jgi:hypothetical protein
VQLAFDVHVASHLQRACEHERVRLDFIDDPYFAGRPELFEQPACVADPAGCDHRVEQLLVIAAFVELADEPAESIGARALGPDETSCENHYITPRQTGCRAWRGAQQPGRGRCTGRVFAARKGPGHGRCHGRGCEKEGAWLPALAAR